MIQGGDTAEKTGTKGGESVRTWWRRFSFRFRLLLSLMRRQFSFLSISLCLSTKTINRIIFAPFIHSSRNYNNEYY